MCVFLFFLNYCLILFNYCSCCTIFFPTTELAIPTGIPNTEAKAETETYSVIVEAKISYCTI